MYNVYLESNINDEIKNDEIKNDEIKNNNNNNNNNNVLTDFNELFQKYLDMSDEDSRKYVGLSKLTNDFINAAVIYSKVIVNEYHLPDDKKSIKLANIGGKAGGLKYITNGLLYKLAEDYELSDGVFLYGGNAANSEHAAKSAGHELKGCSAYFNELHDTPVRVPMQAVVQYRGFTLTVMPVLPLSKMISGSSDGGVNIIEPNDTDAAYLKKAAEKLHICEHLVRGGKKLYTAGDVELHLGHDNRKYLLDLSRTFPPQAYQIISDALKLPPNVKTTKIFSHLFRPELLQILKERNISKPLSSDAFSNWSNNQLDTQSHNQNVLAATKYLIGPIIHECSQELDNFDANDTKSWPYKSLSNWLHAYGINCHLLLLVRQHCHNNDMRSLLFTEVCIRVLKNISRQLVRNTMQNHASYFEVTKVVANFLNLVCGGSEASTKFYEQEVTEGIKVRFGTIFEETDVFEAIKDRLKYIVEIILKSLGFALTNDVRVDIDGNFNGFIFTQQDLIESIPNVKYLDILEYSRCRVLCKDALQYCVSNPKGSLRNIELAQRSLLKIAQSAKYNNIHVNRYLHLCQSYEKEIKCNFIDADMILLNAYNKFDQDEFFLQQLLKLWQYRIQTSSIERQKLRCYGGASSWVVVLKFKDILSSNHNMSSTLSIDHIHECRRIVLENTWKLICEEYSKEVNQNMEFKLDVFKECNNLFDEYESKFTSPSIDYFSVEMLNNGKIILSKLLLNLKKINNVIIVKVLTNCVNYCLHNDSNISSLTVLELLGCVRRCINQHQLLQSVKSDNALMLNWMLKWQVKQKQINDVDEKLHWNIGHVEEPPKSILEYATINLKNIDTTKVILDYGANPCQIILMNSDINEKTQQQPLWLYILYEVIMNKSSIDMFSLLLSSVQDINQRFLSSIDEIVMENDSCISVAVRNQHISLLKLLLKKSDHIDISVNDLMNAAKLDNPDILKCLLKCKQVAPLINSKSNVIDVASVPNIKLLIKAKADVTNNLIEKQIRNNNINALMEYQRNNICLNKYIISKSIDFKCNMNVYEMLFPWYFDQQDEKEENNKAKPLLIKACESENIDLVKLILSYCSQQDCHYNKAKTIITPLTVAITKANIRLVELLIHNKAHVGFVDRNSGKTLIRYAVDIADNNTRKEMVNKLLESKATVNSPIDFGQTSIMRLAEVNDVETMKILLNQNNADPNITPRYGNTALMQSARFGFIECIKLLLESKAEINKVTNHNVSALMKACAAASDTNDSTLLNNLYQTCELLLENGADPNIYGRDGESNLNFVCKSTLDDEALRFVKLLLKFKADPLHVDIYNRNCLMIATYSAHESTLECLINFIKESGANLQNVLDFADDQKNTLLHHCTYDKVNEKQSFGLMKLLVTHNANTNLKNNEGRTCLASACKRSLLSCISLLSKYNEKVDYKLLTVAAVSIKPYETINELISNIKFSSKDIEQACKEIKDVQIANHLRNIPLTSSTKKCC